MTKRGVVFVIVAALLLSGCSVTDISVEQIEEAAAEKVSESVVGEPEIVESISTDKYCYQLLSDEEQIIYDQMLQAMLDHAEDVVLSTKDGDILQKIYDHIFADYGNIFWVSGFSYKTYTSGDTVLGIDFTPTYIYTQEERESYQAQVDAVVTEWLSGISIEDSDYNKSKYVFDIMFQKVGYDTEAENNQNILSVFLGGKSVCQGYADATWYLLNELGIPCTIVRGTANGDTHAWNLVYLDGEYYYTDTTWGNGRYLSQDNTITYQIDYRYMNTTTEFLLQTHTFENNFALPECTATADAYR